MCRVGRNDDSLLSLDFQWKWPYLSLVVTYHVGGLAERAVGIDL
jgi:hypothetical protein